MLLILVPVATDGVGFTHYEISRIIEHIPIFFIGVIIADMESDPHSRPLDSIRNLNWYWKIPINLVLLFIFFTYGSYGGLNRCMDKDDGECEYWRIMTINEIIP
jgi:hypothetical protein